MSNIIDERQIRDLIENLNSLPDKLEKNIVRTSIRAGAAIIRDAIKSNAPEDTGKLKKSITIKSIKGKKGQIIFKVRTGVLKKFKEAGTGAPRHANYAKQIEFGNSQMAAKPFIRPAFDEVESKVLDAVVDKIKMRLDIVNNSQGGKGFE